MNEDEAYLTVAQKTVVIFTPEEDKHSDRFRVRSFGMEKHGLHELEIHEVDALFVPTAMKMINDLNMYRLAHPDRPFEEDQDIDYHDTRIVVIEGDEFRGNKCLRLVAPPMPVCECCKDEFNPEAHT